MPVSSSSSRPAVETLPNRKAALLLMLGLGVGLGGVALFDLYQDWGHQADPLWSTVLENFLPLVIAIGIAYVGGWSYQSREYRPFLPVMAQATAIGGLTTVLLAGVLIGLQGFQGELKPLIIVFQLATLGSLAGLIVGYQTATVEEAKETLREREARLRGLTNSVPGVVYQFFARSDGTYGDAFVSDHAELVLGIPATADNFFERFVAHVPASHREEMLQSIDEAVENREPWQFEMPFEKPSGERVWLLGTSMPEERGGKLIYNGVLLDITERKLREQELRERETQLQQIRENVTDVVWMSPADKSKIEFVSQSFEDIWGRPVERLRQQPNLVVDAIHPDDRERVRSAIEVQKKVPEEYTETYRVVQPGGEIRWVRDRAAGVYDEDGDLQKIIGVATDITEVKEYELELETQTTRLQLALEATDTGIFDWDIEAGEVIWDETSEWLFGYEPGEFPGAYEAWARRVHPEDLPRAEEEIERALEGNGEYQTEFRVELPNDTQRWIEARGVVEHDQQGAPVRMLGIHTDVTERKEKERKLRKAKEEAEEASHLKSAMLANMSHEIRTPLTAITGYSELLRDDLEGEPKAFAEKIHHGGRRLMSTLDSVLQLSKLEAGVGALEREEIVFGDVVEQVVDLLRPKADAKSHTLTVSRPDRPIVGLCNEDAVYRITRNLVENAIKFTPEEGKIEVAATHDGNRAVLEVEDTGIGIGEEALPQIFRAFKQESEGRDREYEGSGLGLSIVRRLTDELGGRIEVNTEKGTGTRFAVHLPLPSSPQEAPATE